MPGTLVKDTLAPVLYDGTAITSKTTTTGAAVEVDKPAQVRVELTTGAMSGSSGTADIEIQGCDSSGFGSGIVSYGRFKQITEADANVTRYLNARVYKTYARAVIITGGTTVTSFTPTVKIRPPDYKRTATDSA